MGGMCTLCHMQSFTCLDDGRDRSEGDGVQGDGVLEGAESREQWVIDSQLVRQRCGACLNQKASAPSSRVTRVYPGITLRLFLFFYFSASLQQIGRGTVHKIRVHTLLRQRHATLPLLRRIPLSNAELHRRNTR